MPPPYPFSLEASGFPPLSVRSWSVSVLPLVTLKMRCVVGGTSVPSLFALSTAVDAPSAFFTVIFLFTTSSPELSDVLVALISPLILMTSPSSAAAIASFNFFHVPPLLLSIVSCFRKTSPLLPALGFKLHSSLLGSPVKWKYCAYPAAPGPVTSSAFF